MAQLSYNFMCHSQAWGWAFSTSATEATTDLYLMTACPLTYVPKQLVILKDRVKCSSLVYKHINSFDRYNQFFATQIYFFPQKKPQMTLLKRK